MPREKICAPTLTVAQALDLRSFDGAKVIAGEAGLDREVSSAMVMEAADIERWGKPGIMVVTSFFALEPLSAEERRTFLERLGDVGPSAIVFKPERLLKEAPADVVAYCEADKVPLVRLDPSTEYRSVLEDVMGSVLDSNLMLLDRFFSIHQSTTRLALSQPSIHVILDQMKKTIGAECTYYDRSSGTCISTSPFQTSLLNLSLKESPRGRYQTFSYFLASFDVPSGERKHALAVSIPSIDAAPSYVLVHAGQDQISPVDLMAIENFTSLLQMELLKQGAIEQRVFRRNNTIVHDLLLNQYTTKQAADDALKELSIDGGASYQALLLRFNMVDPSQGARLEEVMLAFIRQLKHAYCNAVYFESNNRVVFLGNYSTESQSFNLAMVDKILSTLHGNDSLPEFTHLAALSGGVDRYSISQAYDEVIGIYRLFDTDSAHNHTLRFEDLGIYKLFLETRDLDSLEGYIDPRLRRLREKNPTVFDTLIALTNNDMNYAETAEAIFVHPKTVSYRVNQARENFDVDVRDTATLAELVIASRILTLMGEEHE